ncbi:cupin domain-containing protein [Natronomonas sp. EA1]|uniref:cupin domain-containing protein n=1 Tax=Natronomonas sp. EA1 TaxID=3421655 RepID=UPI003EB791C7
MNRYPDLHPEEGEVLTEEVAFNDDTLVKAFALGPGARIEPHEHSGSTNVFHVLEGTVTVIQDDAEERVTAPGVVVHERGVAHGAHNDSEDRAILTATFCPAP